jgi:phosphoribosylamine--glycine ligase
LVIGSGGREHALVWKLARSAAVEQVLCAPGNPGIAQEPKAVCVPADPANAGQIARLAADHTVDLIVVGPEAPLVAGLADELTRRGLLVAGPSQQAARLEGSKIFAKQFMRRHHIPTADFVACDDLPTARQHLERWGGPVVIKADGLAAGKGVVVAANREEAERVLEPLLSGSLVGEGGRRIVLEQRLEGEEVTLLSLTDGKAVLPLAPAQDHKRIWDDDRGPNTGGMGAYCDDSILSDEMARRILDEIVRPTVDGLRAEGIPYRGVLYCGLMITADGPQVIEYNVRFGDPEAQAVLFRLESDLAKLLTAVARGELHNETLAWKRGASACIVASSEGYPGSYPVGRPIEGLERAEAGGAKVFHAGTAMKDGRVVTAGGRVLGITARGADLGAATRAAYEAISQIHFEGMHYRRDIGRKGLMRSRPL